MLAAVGVASVEEVGVVLGAAAMSEPGVATVPMYHT